MQDKHVKTVAGYKLTDRLLGRGSLSRVLLARSACHQRVAVKVIPRQAVPPAERAGFEAAAECLRGKHHDHLVSLIDFKKTQNNFYLFLELCDGGSLADYIRARRRLPEPEALRIFKQVLLGVSALHRSRLPHRDLKPDNILFQDGRVKLAHLGLSRRLDNKELLTAAPEALRRQPLSQKVDVFSAGTILYEMLYGCLPFKARDQQALLEAIDRGVHCAGEGVSLGTQELLREMLTPKPEDRIELLDVLDIVAGFEAQERARRLEEYRASSLSQLQFLCVPGGLSCGLQVTSARRNPREMDQRLYGRLCRKLSAERVAVQ